MFAPSAHLDHSGLLGGGSLRAAVPQQPPGCSRPVLRGRCMHANPREQGEASTSAPTAAAAEQAKPRKFRSSWDAKEASAEADSKVDYLAELGRAEYNINVTHGQNVSHIDSLFTGGQMGLQSDIADGSLRGYEFRSLAHIVGDYYVAPRFLDAIAMHVVKNKLVDVGLLGEDLRVPLILGVWGGKGQGKSFQTELAMKKLGIEPVIMSAGEMESEWAGTPARMIRERYRTAADRAKVRGKLSCLLINDIDAGIGVFANTQRTVNTQMVVGTLMNLADEPNVVSTGQNWRSQDRIQRVPIIVTGNDLSTLFAPLVRDGRMAKFYWEPSRTDLQNILHQMYKDDGMSFEDMGVLLDTFASQPLDFYGALRAATYDGQIRTWIREDVVGADLADEDANMAELSRRLINRERLPSFEPVPLQLEALLAEGRRLAQEQEHVNSFRLSEEYMRNTGTQQSSLIGLSG